MTTKFIFTRSYTFTPDKGRDMFFELVERHGDKVSFRLRDKGNTSVIEADLQIDENMECVTLSCKGVELELWADQYISKGFTAPRLPEPEFLKWVKTREDVLRNAHLYSSHHREEMLESKQCGCYSCQRIFSTDEIEDWTDNGETAICPHCGTDAVIPNVAGIVKNSPELLKALNEKYF